MATHGAVPGVRAAAHPVPTVPSLRSVQDFLCQVERCCRQCHLTTPISFPPEHPVEEVGRLLLCCLLKHEDLGRSHVFAPEASGSRAGRSCSTAACPSLQGTWRCLWSMPAHSGSSRRSTGRCPSRWWTSAGLSTRPSARSLRWVVLTPSGCADGGPVGRSVGRSRARG